ncbi:hematopoietic progenitor cell antigen CD34 isoform X2 [Sylvia atricapilla]
MKWRQLLCIAVCLLELAGCAAESTTDPPTPAAMAVTAGDNSTGTVTTATTATTATGQPNSTKPTSAEAASTSVANSSVQAELLGQLGNSSQPSLTPKASSSGPQGTPGVPTTQSPPPQPQDSANTSGSTADSGSSAATSEHPAAPAATAASQPAGDSAERPFPAIECHSARDQDDAVCLQLNESSSCQEFLEKKGRDLWRVICENGTHGVVSPCKIQLAPFSMDSNCLVLILEGEKDSHKLLSTFPKSHWEKFGIESLKKVSARSRRDSSQKTLIALVTSGLLLAFLGLAGYFLMKRRSWSPAGERL